MRATGFFGIGFFGMGPVRVGAMLPPPLAQKRCWAASRRLRWDQGICCSSGRGVGGRGAAVAEDQDARRAGEVLRAGGKSHGPRDEEPLLNFGP